MKKSFSVYKKGVQPALKEVSFGHKTEKAAEAWVKQQDTGVYIIVPSWAKECAVKSVNAVTKKKTVKVAPKAKRKVKKRT